MRALELAGVATGVLAVAFTVRRSLWCWPVGIVNVGLFAIVFWRVGLLADAGLQLVYLALCVYGWWQWSHGGPAGGELPVGRAPRKILGGLLGAAALFALALGALLSRVPSASWPWLDATLAAGSLAAQALQTRKWIENWAVWIAVDLAYVGLYLAKNLFATAALYAMFTVLAVAGLLAWRRALAGRGAAAGAAVEAAG